MHQFHIIPFQINPPAFNMAVDEFMLKSSGTYLRLYGWKPATLSFGRNQSDFSAIDLDFCRKYGIETVKRITGGKAVLHQHEITYSFASDNCFFSDSVLETYRIISQPLCRFLTKLGLNPEMKKQTSEARHSSLCFRQVSSYEITVNGKKLVGSAQFRNSKRFLQHGSILLDIDWDLWRTVWKTDKDHQGLENRVTCINSELATIPSINDLEDSLIREFEVFFSADTRLVKFDKQKIKAIKNFENQYLSLFLTL